MKFELKAMKQLANELGAKCNVVSIDGDTRFIWFSEDIQEPTPEQIQKRSLKIEEEYELTKAADKLKAERTALLDNGMTTADGEFWFNEKWATVFMTKALSAEFVGLPAIQWKDAKGVVVQVPLDKAKVYIGEMIEALDKVYLG